MPNHCLVISCNSRGRNRTSLPVSFYRMPAIRKTNGTIDFLKYERRLKWIEALNRDDLTESLIFYGRICSKHFITGKPATLCARNHVDWVPSVLMTENPISTITKDDNEILSTGNKRIRRKFESKEVKRLNKTPKLDQKRSATLCVKPKQRKNLYKREVKEPSYNSYHGKSLQRIELHDDVKYKEMRVLFGSTLDNIKIMTQKVESYARLTNVAKKSELGRSEIIKSQGDIFYEDISLLENSIRDVNAILSDSLIITDNDNKCVKKEYIADEISVLKSENSNLTKEMGMLIAKIAKLEAEIESSQVQPQTIIYNPRDTPTILLVTNDS